MQIAIMGGCGFVGKNLVRHLLTTTDHTVHALCPYPRAMDEFSPYGERCVAHKCDVFDTDTVTQSLRGVEVAYYLVHMMGKKSVHLYDAEEKAARSFARAAREVGVSRVIYLSGLGRDAEHLSEHLSSRHHTGDILREHLPLVIEFRASMIIGRESISYEIIRGVIEYMPFVIVPKWTRALTQPIGLSDVLSYLTAAISVPLTGHEVVEIGGPDVLSYKNFLSLYARHTQRRRAIVCVPFVPEWLAGLWLHVFLPKDIARVGRHMFSSLRHDTVVTNNRAKDIFPRIQPAPIQNHFV